MLKSVNTTYWNDKSNDITFWKYFQSFGLNETKLCTKAPDNIIVTTVVKLECTIVKIFIPDVITLKWLVTLSMSFSDMWKSWW